MEQQKGNLMLKPIASALMVLVLVGCATPAPDMSHLSGETYPVPVQAVRVDNFSQGMKAESGVWSEKYIALDDSATSPPFTQLVYNRASQGLVAAGGQGAVEVAILRASLLQDSRVADSVPFIGIASALSPRDHKCYVDANFRYQDLSVRQSFEVVRTLPRSWYDADVDVKKSMLDECLGEILQGMQEFSIRLAGQSERE